MRRIIRNRIAQIYGLALCAAAWGCSDSDPVDPGEGLDAELGAYLQQLGFTGTIEQQLASKLGRPIDSDLADLGRLLFFDRLPAIHSDTDGAGGNSCSGCHSPTAGFGDTQPIAIGVDNNGIAGVDRAGPRNQRRTPTVINTVFYPRLMLDGRFFAPSGDPFDNGAGFRFPDPEGASTFVPNDPAIRHLLTAQAHIPVTELPEMAGFTGSSGTSFASFVEKQSFRRSLLAASGAPAPTDVFDDGHGLSVPQPDSAGYRNVPIRDVVVERLNANENYRELFGGIYPAVAQGQPITYTMISQALAEFEFSLTFANAPIDRFARGDRTAMKDGQKRGGLIFFGKGECVSCHAVSGESNEMFSDFENHRIGVPPLAPTFGVGKGNVMFAGPNSDEDFGAEHSTGNEADRYAFRTSPLRNIAVQPFFMHNGAFSRLEDAIRHHLDVYESARSYNPAAAGIPADLRILRPPVEPILANIDPRLRDPIQLTQHEFNDLVAFVRDALLDPRAKRENTCLLLPASLPSGMPVGTYQGCN